MISGAARNKILKSWAGVSEVALIKEVATKGEHIQLCIEYGAQKRNMPVADYQIFFHDVVQTYVQRLLSERLVCKAENVLRNMQRDVACCYFQFACETEDSELQEMVLEHLRRKDAQFYAQHLLDLQYNFQLLQQLRACPATLTKCQKELKRNVNLEALMTCDAGFRKRLEVELYFLNRSPELLQRLDKLVLWNYLVETQQMPELIRWCYISNSSPHDDKESYNDLEQRYAQWTLEPEMYEYAVRSLPAPNEVIRNCFASLGYYFVDERDVVPISLQRICTTGSFDKNREVLEKLPIARYLLQHGYYELMLQNFVSTRELEELSEEQLEQSALLRFIVTLKENNLTERQGFEQIAKATKTLLESQEVDFQSAQPLVTLFDFLCNAPTISSLNCFLLSSALKYLPYLHSLCQRLESSGNVPQIPSAYDLLRKFKQLDFRRLSKQFQLDPQEQQQLACFSNERICGKYARKYQLNFLHYLKQQRSAYAVYYLLTEQLQHYAQLTKGQLFSATESVIELALQHTNNPSLLTHCVAFIEMLGYDSQQLRCFLKLRRLLLSTNKDNAGNATVTATHSFSQLMHCVEQLLLQHLQMDADKFPLSDYQALIHLVGCAQKSNWPKLIMRHYASENDWWRLLVLMQYFEVPLEQLQLLLDHFATRIVGEHMLRALSHDLLAICERNNNKYRATASRQHIYKPAEKAGLTTSVETVTSSISSSNEMNILQSQQLQRFLPDSTTGSPDFFAIVLLSGNNSNQTAAEEVLGSGSKFLELLQDSQNTSIAGNLLKHCAKYRLPLLAILAASVSPINISWKWAVWLAVSTDQWQQVLRLAGKDLQELCWCLIENCVRLGYTYALYRSFCIFQEDNPFLHFFHFLHRTQHYRDFEDGVVHELRLFLLAWSNNEVKLPLCIGQPKRDQLMLRSIKLLLLHLQYNFDSMLDQQRYLSCICRSDIGDIACGGGLFDFCLLHRVFDVLQSLPGWSEQFELNFEQLVRRDSREYEKLLGAILADKHYDVAVHLSSLLHLPISDIVYAKWVAALEEQEQCSELHTLQQIFKRQEEEIVEHSLPPELLVNFYLYAVARLEEPGGVRKYMLLQRALNVIKRHHLLPNESFDRDQIEYEMIVCYIQVPDPTQLEIYHSDYYEQIMIRERCVLYKSFLELKELAGIDDLNVPVRTTLTDEMLLALKALINRLLDEGDIVEALRLQEMFDCRSIDLRFVVFCMALAEGVTTMCSMSSEERQLLRDIEKSSFARFNRRMLSVTKVSTTSHSPTPRFGSSQSSEFSDSCSTLEFEEIPSKEKRETLDTIQGIASKLKYGIELGRRVLMAYRAAMYLDKEYMDVLRTKDVTVLLKSVSEDGGCLHRLLVVSDILTSTHMTPVEIAQLLAFELCTAIIRPRFYIFSADQQTRNNFKNADLWGYNVDRELHLFLELTPSSTQLGHCLLGYCDALRAYRKYQDGKPFERNAFFAKLTDIIARYGLPTPAVPPSSSPANSAALNTQSVPLTPDLPPQVLSHKKQNLICVELLIKAHECFMHECCMEGMADVLHRAKSLTAVLTKAKSWSLMVRLLIGLARYREMFYCFDALIEHHQFESLLGQFDEEKTNGLRQAILSYLREYRAENGKEYLKLAALHFLMYKELAEMWEQDAVAVISKILNLAKVDEANFAEHQFMNNLNSGVSTKICIPKLRCSTGILSLLQQALENYTHATENYLLDNKLLLAQKSASKAEMVAVQMDLVRRVLERDSAVQLKCVCVISVQSRDEFREMINGELSVPQALILSRAYGYDINWSETLLSQYVILQKRAYLQQYLAHLPINDGTINNIVKGYQLFAQRHKSNAQMEEHLAQLVDMVKSITLKYKLASLLSLKGTVLTLLNDHTLYYLRDTNYGRNESYNNMPDM